MAETLNREDICILAAGDIVDYPAVAALIPPGAYIICADGGYGHCRPLGITPHLLMGDFDSIREQPPEDLPRIQLPVDKDYTDTAFAIREAVRLGCRSLLLAGMLGGRLDHTLANLQCLGWCAGQGISARLTDGVTHVYAFAGDDAGSTYTLHPYHNHYFSVFSADGSCASVTLQGGVYPLEEYPLGSLDPRAVSNEFRGVPVQVTVRGGVVLVMVIPR